MKRVVLLEEAVDDLVDAKAFYERIEPGVGTYCSDSLLADIERLALNAGIHPSELGTYLAACVFVAVLTGESPEGLVNAPKTLDHEGESIILMRIPNEDAKFCQQVAKEAVRAYMTGQTE